MTCDILRDVEQDMQQIPGYGIVGNILSLNETYEALIILIFRQKRTNPVG